MERTEKRSAPADVCIGATDMPREKKDAKNFGCKFDSKIFEDLEESCKISGQSKTTVVERAVQKYLDENLEKMREFSKQL